MEGQPSGSTNTSKNKSKSKSKSKNKNKNKPPMTHPAKVPHSNPEELSKPPKISKTVVSGKMAESKQYPESPAKILETSICLETDIEDTSKVSYAETLRTPTKTAPETKTKEVPSTLVDIPGTSSVCVELFKTKDTSRSVGDPAPSTIEKRHETIICIEMPTLEEYSTQVSRLVESDAPITSENMPKTSACVQTVKMYDTSKIELLRVAGPETTLENTPVKILEGEDLPASTLELRDEIIPTIRKGKTVHVSSEASSTTQSTFSLSSSGSCACVDMVKTAELRQPKVLFSRVTDEKVKAIVTKLGGIIVTNPKNATHLVMNRVRRTCTLFEALSHVNYVLTTKWLLDSVKERKFLPVDDYKIAQIRVPDPDEERMYSIEAVLRSPRRNALFKDILFYTTPGIYPTIKLIIPIIEGAGGKVEQKRSSRQDIIQMEARKHESYIIITCPSDYDHWADLVSPSGCKCRIASFEVIMHSIMSQKMTIMPYLLHFRFTGACIF